MLLFCYLFLLLPLHIAQSAQFDNPDTSAIAVSVNGKVTAGEKPLIPGSQLKNGEIITTKDKASAKLLMRDRSIFDLGPNTRMRLGETAATKDAVAAEIDVGSVRAAIESRLNRKGRVLIKTKASVLAVRGTELVITISQKQDTFAEKVTIASGIVDRLPIQGTMPPVALTSGNQLALTGEIRGNKIEVIGAPVTSNLSQAQVSEIVSVNTTEDRTFQQAVSLSTSGATQSEDSATHGKVVLQPIATSFDAHAKSMEENKYSESVVMDTLKPPSSTEAMRVDMDRKGESSVAWSGSGEAEVTIILR